MNNLSLNDCLAAIARGDTFQAVVADSVAVKIEDYGFFVCTAIHDGHQLRADVAAQCLLSDGERRYEEDPYTAELISAMPITLVALDSRYEYDLNRLPETCVYEQAWGKTVWEPALSADQQQQSRAKHQQFYTILKAIISKLETLHGNCVVYDLHSYNHVRLEQKPLPPTFNIGTAQLDKHRWQQVIKHWRKSLATIQLSNINTRSALDEVFFGKGYLATFVKQQFKHTLVLPTEVKKVFMDELTGDVYPLVLNELKVALKAVILANAVYFSKQHQPKTPSIKADLLSSEIEPAVLRLDEKLYRLAKGINTLAYINPKNIVRERRRFFAKHYNYQPTFNYRQLKINPFEFREKLYRLPVDKISDVSIQQVYRDVIDSFATKIDLLSSIGTDNFLYNSLRYYGEPNDEDIKIANFLLFAKPFAEDLPRDISPAQAKQRCMSALKAYGIAHKGKVEITNKIVAAAMVKGHTMLINKSVCLNEMELNALIHHELGVHMVTTVNASAQKLHLFKLGLPDNTYTQEGLAILAEYMTGNMHLTRLKTLALRVIAVKMMVNRHDFSHTFKTLINDYGLDRDEAFRLTVRVYRGGGFTKDFLYLRGIKDALQLYQKTELKNLYIGKTSFAYLKILDEMVARNMATPPHYLPMYLKTDMNINNNPIIDYLIHSTTNMRTSFA